MADPAFVSQATQLLSDAGGWVAGLSASGGGLMMAYHAVMRNLNDDPQAVSHHTGSMKKVLAGTAIAASAGGLVALMGTYFHP